MQLENTLKMPLPLFSLVNTNISLLCTNHSPTSICFGLHKGHRKTIATLSHWTANNYHVINMSFEEEFKDSEHGVSQKPTFHNGCTEQPEQNVSLPPQTERTSPLNASHAHTNSHLLPLLLLEPLFSVNTSGRIRYPSYSMPLSQPP